MYFVISLLLLSAECFCLQDSNNIFQYPKNDNVKNIKFPKGDLWNSDKNRMRIIGRNSSQVKQNMDVKKIQSNSKDIIIGNENNFIFGRHYVLSSSDFEIQDVVKPKGSLKAKAPNRTVFWPNKATSSIRKSSKPRFTKEDRTQRRSSRAAVSSKKYLWEQKVIPYDIDKIFSGAQKALFREAMNNWENFTCVRFVERKPNEHENYIFFTVRSCGCCSYVGKRGKGKQFISIAPHCEKFGTVLHELGHVLGLWHEHTRDDRDEHVQINLENVLNGQESNFRKQPSTKVVSLGLPYDYNSIMHYARNTFSKSNYLETITPLKRDFRIHSEMGQRHYLSEGDINQINILYECTKCGQTFHSSSGRFMSPNFETKQFRQNVEHCEWRISCSIGEVIYLRIRELNLITTNGSCEMDYLEIRDGYWVKSPLLKRMCGNITSPVLLQTKSNRMLLTYKNSNILNGFKGFAADYQILCGGKLLVEDQQKIYSPNYPMTYPGSKECVWTVTTTEGFNVALHFTSFDLEDHDTCSYDFVEIRDGDSLTSDLIGIFCGYKTPPNIKSTGNKLLIRFVSDKSIGEEGFSAIVLKELDECKLTDHGCQQKCFDVLGGYECSCEAGYELQSDKKSCQVTCGGIIRADSGILTSPRFPSNYPPSIKCAWEIVAEINHNIFLNFTHLDLEGFSNLDCSLDYIVVYSILQDGRLRKIGTFCGETLPPVIKSEHNILRLELITDESNQKSGFSTSFTTDVDECATGNGGCDHFCRNTYGSYECTCDTGYKLQEDGKNCTETACKYELLDHRGTIHSPNFPKKYPRDTYCYWHFLTLPGHRILVNFSNFEMEDHQECIYDYVAFFDGGYESSATLGYYCGTRTNLVISSSSNKMLMVMKTDSSLEKVGFLASYTTECGGYLVATQKKRNIFSHPYYGQRTYQLDSHCTWKIQTNMNNIIKLTFTMFEIEYTKDCSYDFVEVFEEARFNESIYHGKFCGNNILPEITSISNTLVIRFITDSSVKLKGFSATYWTLESLEGNSFDASEDYAETNTDY